MLARGARLRGEWPEGPSAGRSCLRPRRGPSYLIAFRGRIPKDRSKRGK